MFIGNSNISLFFPNLHDINGEMVDVKWLGAIKITDYPIHPAMKYLFTLRQNSSKPFFLTLGTHDIIQICRNLNNNLKDKLNEYASLYLNFFQQLNTYAPTYLILFPLPLNTIKINNLTIKQRQEVVLKFNEKIFNVLSTNEIIVIYPWTDLFNDSNQVKLDYLHTDNLHLNTNARSIYLTQIKELCELNYFSSEPSLEKFNYSNEVDVFVYLWLTNCKITNKKMGNRLVKTLLNKEINILSANINTFFQSLHLQYSNQPSTNNIELLKCDLQIMHLNPYYIHELKLTLERALPNKINYGVVFFWHGLWLYNNGEIEKAISELKKSIATSLQNPFPDTQRVTAYIRIWQSCYPIPIKS